MKDLTCTSGISPNLQELIQSYSGSAGPNSSLVSTYEVPRRTIHFQTVNNYYINDPSQTIFDNRIMKNERLLTKREIADFLNISIKMIDRKVSMNEIPYLKIGRLVRFSKERVLAWANESNPKG